MLPINLLSHIPWGYSLSRLAWTFSSSSLLHTLLHSPTHCLHLGRHIHLPATPICRRFLCLPSTATITNKGATYLQRGKEREREIWLEYFADMEKSQNKFVSRCQLIRRPHCAYAPCCVLWYVMRRNCFTFALVNALSRLLDGDGDNDSAAASMSLIIILIYKLINDAAECDCNLLDTNWDENFHS